MPDESIEPCSKVARVLPRAGGTAALLGGNVATTASLGGNFPKAASLRGNLATAVLLGSVAMAAMLGGNFAMADRTADVLGFLENDAPNMVRVVFVRILTAIGTAKGSNEAVRSDPAKHIGMREPVETAVDLGKSGLRRSGSGYCAGSGDLKKTASFHGLFLREYPQLCSALLLSLSPPREAEKKKRGAAGLALKRPEIGSLIHGVASGAHEPQTIDRHLDVSCRE